MSELTNPGSPTNLCRTIVTSADAEDLERIRNAIKTRADLLVRQQAASLAPGDKGRTGGNLRPAYLLNLPVTVVAVRTRGTRVDVRLDDPSLATMYPRYIRSDGTLPGLPISCFIPTPA